jgi:hypothetical protein
MRVDTALLCDAATVREGLLHILGGGVSQVIRPAFPAELGVTLALRIMVHPTELDHPHDLQIVLQDDDGLQITKVDLHVEVGDRSAVPAGEEGEILLPWSFPGRPLLPHEGRYSFEVLIDGNHQLSVPLRAALPPTEGGPE